MHIVHTESSQGWGGQEIRILSESEGMRARGHRVTVIAPASARVHQEAQRRGIETADLPLARKSLRGVVALRRWLAAHPVDVINTHSSTDSWIVAVACSTLRAPPAIVRTRHVSVPIAKNAATRWLYTGATRHIVTTGETLRRQLIDENRFPPERLTSVPTGIDARRFAPGDRAAARVATGTPCRPDAHRHRRDPAELERAPVPHRGVRAARGRAARARDRGRRAAARSDRSAGPRASGSATASSSPAIRPTSCRGCSPSTCSRCRRTRTRACRRRWCRRCCAESPASRPASARFPRLHATARRRWSCRPRTSTRSRARSRRLVADPALRQRLGQAAREHCMRQFGYEAMLDRMEAVFRDAAAAHSA